MAVQIEKDSCSGCKSCVDACPSSAITCPADVAIVNEAECIDCGACVDACPSSALKMP